MPRISLNDSTLLTTVADFAARSATNWRRSTNCCDHCRSDSTGTLISDSTTATTRTTTTMSDGDDANCSKRDDSLLDVPVRVLRPSVGAISFVDFETRSKFRSFPSLRDQQRSLTFTCASVIFKPLANCERSEEAKYVCR